MNEKEILLQLMKETGINKTTLSELAGYNSKSAVTEILNRKGMQVNILVKLLEALGCELVIRHEGKEWLMTETPLSNSTMDEHESIVSTKLEEPVVNTPTVEKQPAAEPARTGGKRIKLPKTPTIDLDALLKD